ncbi:hypothetical protein Tco_0344449 [Tanacetum coccineum]
MSYQRVLCIIIVILLKNIRVILKVFTVKNGNLLRANIKQDLVLFCSFVDVPVLTRTDSTVAKPSQEDSYAFYVITYLIVGVAIMYQRNKYKRNRLICMDELYKFSDGTLTSVRSVLHDIACNLRMDYLPKKRWINLNRPRSRAMIKAIDKLLLERRLMRSLEKFVGGRDYGEDFRLLERTI